MPDGALGGRVMRGGACGLGTELSRQRYCAVRHALEVRDQVAKPPVSAWFRHQPYLKVAGTK